MESQKKSKNQFTRTAKPTRCKKSILSLKKQTAFLVVTLLSVVVLFNTSFAQANENEKKLTPFLENKGYTAFKLQKYVTGQLYTEIAINGVTGRFLIDSGAGATIVEEKRKDKFNMTTTPSEKKGTSAGGETAIQLPANNKQINSKYAIDESTLMLMNLDHMNTAFKQHGLEEIDGVIGAELLLSGKAIIDYANMILYLKK